MAHGSCKEGLHGSVWLWRVQTLAIICYDDYFLLMKTTGVSPVPALRNNKPYYKKYNMKNKPFMLAVLLVLLLISSLVFAGPIGANGDFLRKNDTLPLSLADFPKVEKSFAKHFSPNLKPTCFRLPQSLWFQFQTQGNNTHASFSESGRMNYAITYIDKERIPEYVWKKISRNYPSFKFFLAKEVNDGNAVSYLVILEELRSVSRDTR
jgi:hypothetical protein